MPTVYPSSSSSSSSSSSTSLLSTNFSKSAPNLTSVPYPPLQQQKYQPNEFNEYIDTISTIDSSIPSTSLNSNSGTHLHHEFTNLSNNLISITIDPTIPHISSPLPLKTFQSSENHEDSVVMLTVNDEKSEDTRQSNNLSPFPTPNLQKKLFHLNNINSLRKSFTSSFASMKKTSASSSIVPSPLINDEMDTICIDNDDHQPHSEQDHEKTEALNIHWKEIKKIQRRDSLSGVNGELYGSLIGSYEESILTGRLSTPPSKPLNFICQVGVLATDKTKSYLKCPPHIIIPFKASFYDWSDTGNNGNNSLLPPPQPSQTHDLTQLNSSHYALSPVSTSFLDESLAGNRRRSSTASSSDSRISAYSSSAQRARFGSMTEELGTPYVGTVDLEWGLGHLNNYGYSLDSYDANSLPGLQFIFWLLKQWIKCLIEGNRSKSDPLGSFRIPLKGRLQILVKNENKTVVKVFLVPYDFRQLKPYERTFLRQKSFSTSSMGRQDIDCLTNTQQHQQLHNDKNSSLRYALHLQFLCLPSSTINGGKKLFLFKSIRAVFSHRVPEGTEKLKIVYETPEGKFDEDEMQGRQISSTNTTAEE